MFPISDNIPSRNPPLMMWGLMAINVLVFLLETSLSEAQLKALFYWFGLVPARFSHPQWALQIGLPIDTWWPFLTSMFLHGGWLHLIGNMWVLWIFGDNVEDRMGSLRFLAFYLLCGVLAAAVQFFSNPHSTLPTVGASGAIAGVLGAYLVMYPMARVVVMIPVLIFPFFFDVPAVLFLGFWFLLNFTSGLSALSVSADAGGIAWWAHAGGFVGGMLLYRFFQRPDWRPCYEDEYGVDGSWQR